MINKKVIFNKIIEMNYPAPYTFKEVSGIILDKYADISNGKYACDFYLVELEDGSLCSIHPFEVIKIIKENNLNQQP